MRLALFFALTLPLVAADPLGITNAADFEPVAAPGSLIAIFGPNLSKTTKAASSLPLPLSLDGVEVKANGRALPLHFVSPGQINAQLSPDIAPGTVTLTVGELTGTLRVQATAPALFRLSGDLAWPYPVMPGATVPVFGTGIGPVSVNVAPGAAPPDTELARATRPASVKVGGLDAPVAYAGLTPQTAGIAQWNFKVPALPAGDHEIVVNADGASSKPAKLRIATTQLADQVRSANCTGEGPVLYTELPLALSDMAVFIPLGLMIGGHVTPIDHQYFFPKQGPRDTFPVRAPAAGYVIDIQRRTNFVGDPSPNNPTRTDEYRLVIEHSCTFYTYLDLLTSIDPALANWSRGSRVKVEAGQLLGRIGGQSLDFGTVNLHTFLPGFIVPEHYIAEPWKPHTVDPLDYFTAPLRAQINSVNPRKAEPRGGRIDYDADGQLIGNWFREGTNGYKGADPSAYWRGHFSAAPSHLDPNYFTLSLGDVNGTATQFWAKGNAPQPSTVTVASGLVKYELINIGVNLRDAYTPELFYLQPTDQVQGTLLVQLLENRRLKLEVFPGKRAAEVPGFSSAAQLYER